MITTISSEWDKNMALTFMHIYMIELENFVVFYEISSPTENSRKMKNFLIL